MPSKRSQLSARTHALHRTITTTSVLLRLNPVLAFAAYPPWAEQQYRCIKLLSDGVFGSVWLVSRADSGTMHVLKDIHAPGHVPGDGKLPLEAELLNAQEHPFILRVNELMYDQPSGQLCMVTEFCDRGDLHSLLTEARRRGESVPGPQLLTWLVQLCLALAHLHRQRVLHRDIKTSNIFVSADR